MCKFMILLSFFVFATQASMFQPIGIKKQLQESSGVVQGVVMAVESIELDGNIVTRVELDAQRASSKVIQDSPLIELYYDGGQVGDRIRKIHGSPKFNLGEHVVVFTLDFDYDQKNVTAYRRGKKWVNGIGLGKYSIKKVGGEKMMVNQIFPQDPKMGQVKLKEFYKMYKRFKGEELHHALFDKYEKNKPQLQKINKSPSRSIASVSGIQAFSNKKEDSKIPIPWYLIALGLLVLLFAFVRKKFS